MAKRKKKHGPVLSQAADYEQDAEPDVEDDLPGDGTAQRSARRSASQPRRQPASKRNNKRQGASPRPNSARSGSPRRLGGAKSRPGSQGDDDGYAPDRRSRRPGGPSGPQSSRGDGSGSYRPVTRMLHLDGDHPYPDDDDEVPYDDADPRERAVRPVSSRGQRASPKRSGPSKARASAGDDADDYVDVNDYDDYDEEEDYEDLGEFDLDDDEAAEGEIKTDRSSGPPAAGSEQIKERKTLLRELKRVRAIVTADDVLLRMRRQQAAEISNSAIECDESIEQVSDAQFFA